MTEPEAETSDESRDDKIYTMRLLGRSPRTIARDFGLSLADVDKIVDAQTLKVDAGYRLRTLKLDLDRIEMLQSRYLRDALNGDLAAGHLWLRLAERKAAALGTDSAVRIDLVQVPPASQGHEKLRASLDRLLGRSPPVTDEDEPDEPPATH